MKVERDERRGGRRKNGRKEESAVGRRRRSQPARGRPRSPVSHLPPDWVFADCRTGRLLDAAPSDHRSVASLVFSGVQRHVDLLRHGRIRSSTPLPLLQIGPESDVPASRGSTSLSSTPGTVALRTADSGPRLSGSFGLFPCVEIRGIASFVSLDQALQLFEIGPREWARSRHFPFSISLFAPEGSGVPCSPFQAPASSSQHLPSSAPESSAAVPKSWFPAPNAGAVSTWVRRSPGHWHATWS